MKVIKLLKLSIIAIELLACVVSLIGVIPIIVLNNDRLS